MLAANGRETQPRCSCPACSGAARGTGGENTQQWTVEQTLQWMTQRGAWAGAGSGPLTLTYSFPTSPDQYGADYGAGSGTNGEMPGFRALTEAQRAAARQALALWADVANVRFVEVEGGGGAIRFANTTTGPDYAWAYYPSTAGSSGDVWINPNQAVNSQLSLGTFGYETFIHELGHALGLNHAADYNGASAPTEPVHNFDTVQYTLMSYMRHRDPESRDIFPSTPMLLDIMAIQRLYGANTTTRTGNTTYGFNATQDVTRAELNFAVNQRPMVAIWDAAGIDTLDVSGYGANQTIDLRAGAYSSVGGMRNNVAIAVGARIENAVGGSGNDTIVGNEANNLLRGGGGGDRYVIMGRSFGRDVINDAQGQNEIVFNDLRSGDVRLVRQGSDLMVATADGGSSVLLRNYYAAGGAQAYRLSFTDGGTPQPPTPNPRPRPQPQPQPRDAGDTFATAMDLGTLNGPTTRVVRGGVGGNDRADVYRFRVLSGQRASVTLSGMSADADLFVYNARGQLLAQSINGGTLPDRIAGSIGAGTYYIAVMPYNGVRTNYQLSVGIGGAAAQRSVARRVEGGTAQPVTGRQSLALRDQTSLDVATEARASAFTRRERDRHGDLTVGG
ncbi:MAG TPA: M10 family metallopeptidase C-terminal domain-containing protein [Geminicoccaceae bacterium]|nr:M10 family metallopeptidase C-terminal domain-containing protein [Geminicoccaceae bacterium]